MRTINVWREKVTYVIDVNLLDGYTMLLTKIINGVMCYGYALLNKMKMFNGFRVKVSEFGD